MNLWPDGKHHQPHNDNGVPMCTCGDHDPQHARPESPERKPRTPRTPRTRRMPKGGKA